MNGFLATIFFWKKTKDKPLSTKVVLFVLFYAMLMIIVAFTLFIIGT